MTNTASGLIGYSGFVGQSLLRQRKFDHLYRSTNIGEIHGREFDLLVCSGAPAQKWIANKEPEKDAAAIDGLISSLSTVSAKSFVLISTVDVFGSKTVMDETTCVETEGLHPYGYNRFRLEEFVRAHFPSAKIIRLPGLVGPGLRKNAIYDLKHGNNVAAIDSRGVFQFYPMVNLWADICRAISIDGDLFHFSAAPVSMEEVAREAFGLEFKQEVVASPARYDMRSVFADRFGGADGYLYSKREEMIAIRAYSQGDESAAAKKG